jgi:serine/threonine-protein kinase
VTEPGDRNPPAPDAVRLVAGRYRLAEVIGVGGMATVHRALDTKLGRTVAVKLLRREVIADTDIAMRFRREALAATVLRHPNIVGCLETGTDDGQPFLVMELIEGEDLAARLRRVGRLAPAETARIGLDVARGLGVAHVRGIVHRDVKPGNILLARDGRAMVTDFGIARLAADAEGAVPGTTLGSVHYFSPEQAKGETTTAASDVYSLGLVMYECLTGRRAWTGETTAALAAARIGAAAPSPRAVRPEVPAALDAIVVRALDPDPARRFANGNALAGALDPLFARPAALQARPDPTSPTVGLDTAGLAAATATAGAIGAIGAAAVVAAAGGAPSAGAGAAASFAAGGPSAAASALGRGPASHSSPPVRPPSEPTPPTAANDRAAAIRRAPPAIAAPLFVLGTVVAIVAGALFVASLPGRGDAVAIGLASPTPRATRTPVVTRAPTPSPTPLAKPTPAPKPTPVPAATAKPKPGAAADLCDPIFGVTCRLDAGTYEPSKFAPSIRFVLGDGWSTTLWQSDLIVLGRPEGSLTIAGGIKGVYPSGKAEDPPRTARGIVETFIGTDGVAAGRPDDVKIDKRKATVIDLAPMGPDRIELFGTSTQTYYLEPVGTTRIVVIDGKDGPLVIAIEPAEDSTFEAVLPTTEKVVASIRFR